MEILIRKSKELFEGVCNICNNQNEHEIGLISSSSPPANPPPPLTTPLPPPGWLMKVLVFHQGIFARSFLHFFAVICRCQILARSTQGCDWQISPTPPLPALVTSWLLSSIQGHFLYFWSTLYHRSASITWDHHHHQHKRISLFVFLKMSKVLISQCALCRFLQNVLKCKNLRNLHCPAPQMLGSLPPACWEARNVKDTSLVF